MTSGPLNGLGITNPVFAAPMGGGPTTPAMVVAAASVGSLGFLAGGYKTPEELAEQIRKVRSATDRFGVNLFVPTRVPVDPEAFRQFASAIQVEADLYDLNLSEAPIVEDDDHWRDKLDILLRDPVPVVSFTFGVPDTSIIAALRKAGSVVIQTVTSGEEARLAVERSVDVLMVQGSQAGGHFGTLTPEHRPPQLSLAELVRQVHAAAELPIVAAGGIASSNDVAAVLGEGAFAAAVGTVLLRTDESGASETHKTALSDRSDGRTLVTRAFTGRPARALANLFTDRYDRIAPFGYPAVHHLTVPIRRAAAAAGDPERVNLWAGTGFRFAREGSTGAVLSGLAEDA